MTQAIRGALAWLAQHQSADGSWSCDRFADTCGHAECEGPGQRAEYTVGTTALALLALVRSGSGPRWGPHRAVVRRACGYLRSVQGTGGAIGPDVNEDRHIYNHVLATLALVEAYGGSGGAASIRPLAQRAVDFLVAAQNPGAGWRYGVRPGESDTSVTGWAVEALRAAQRAKLQTPVQTFLGARAWLDRVTDDSFYVVGYTQPGDSGPVWHCCGGYIDGMVKPMPNFSITAAGLHAKLSLGASPRSQPIHWGARLLRRGPPQRDRCGGFDLHYWYHATAFMQAMGGQDWARWEPSLHVLPTLQRRHGHASGSFNPASPWGAIGGRVYATAMATLTLLEYRSAPEPIDPRGCGD